MTNEQREEKVAQAMALGVEVLVTALWDAGGLALSDVGDYGDVFPDLACDPEAILDRTRPSWRSRRRRPTREGSTK